MIDCRPIDLLMDPNSKLLPRQGEPLTDAGRYQRLVGKLNYLTITQPDISFVMSVVIVIRMQLFEGVSKGHLVKDYYMRTMVTHK